ncbi:Riboflavin kinase / FMN adenylyltransferase [Bathymodiolus heckerae thiotrophic gill symbiont]|uniref:bifunctional riboflavin kinase/FAD synthetase n=1 Tax=Bathymodiolus heckerae thiotrophic gill symbiont TaxID=1052212 RepID=UPI0010B0EAE9|nr:bifunctional riboflavin kinase/FAD synthetase [Bathymodiolus heckerae thiotrophic gill symbiont]CAC9434678.1 FMN adenylyltransferase (EC 2.7.7.2) / Riboflavin kinase (EC 2.7.1.26) [uncultured Gammaproteobacteria bacterium]SMN12991.1 Riboflavin kinase / FMN adenylyltransferase [Bathymodiolus heckerae thiotrophic gill symbiont]SMN14525.1 Riboflavin kinase / FMN adenylyltransferase [uncultured Candidatus Thioglobus sp.]
MKLIRGLQNLKSHLNSVVTIGNFDGVHLGHQKIILRLVEKSKKMGVPSVLISFSPTPQSFFGYEQASLSSFKEKHTLLSALGLDIHLVIHFNQSFSQLEAQDFVQEILLNKLGMKHCLIGDDFRFGKNRKGDFTLLQNLSKAQGFTVEKTPSVLHNNCRISSSKARSLLKQGELQSAAQILGREFSITGKIIHGLKNGRNIGFPTINIPIKRKISPIHGIFAVIVELDGATYQGVCSIGNRPVIGDTKTLLEVFLFDFNREVYGLEANTIFKHKIRDERNFDNFSTLKKQIELDVADAKKYFD